jgi:hypothetical protein
MPMSPGEGIFLSLAALEMAAAAAISSASITSVAGLSLLLRASTSWMVRAAATSPRAASFSRRPAVSS